MKIAPDLSKAELEEMASIFLAEKIDGIIATNTSSGRHGIENSMLASQTGGLSGKPLKTLATQIIHQLSPLLKNQIPIIGCGGIFSGCDAQEKIEAGARLVQLYTGLIYQGPGLIEECVKQIQTYTHVPIQKKGESFS